MNRVVRESARRDKGTKLRGSKNKSRRILSLSLSLSLSFESRRRTRARVRFGELIRYILRGSSSVSVIVCETLFSSAGTKHKKMYEIRARSSSRSFSRSPSLQTNILVGRGSFKASPSEEATAVGNIFMNKTDGASAPHRDAGEKSFHVARRRQARKGGRQGRDNRLASAGTTPSLIRNDRRSECRLSRRMTEQKECQLQEPSVEQKQMVRSAVCKRHFFLSMRARAITCSRAHRKREKRGTT